LASKLVENTVGIHLARNHAKVYYWQNRREIDFVVIHQGKLVAVEVKFQETINPADFACLKAFSNAFLVTPSDLKVIDNVCLIPEELSKNFLVRISYLARQRYRK
jgi:predicted AAA+ superfamily ATPase